MVAGYGIVGKFIKSQFPFAETYDLDSDMGADYLTVPEKKFDICFVCVPTPDKNGECETKYVETVLQTVKADVFVIKSTVPPTSCELFKYKYHVNVVFSPEYTGATQHINKADDFVILGGDNESVHKVRQLYELTKSCNFTIKQVTTVEAEIAKYMENCFLGLKVVFCNEFKEIADLYGADYDNIRDCFVMDERVGKSHTFVYDNHRGYDSKCLNKDIPAIVTEIKRRNFKKEILMECVDRINKEYRS